MATPKQLVACQPAASGSWARIAGSVTYAARRMAEWLEACADYWAAAALYDELRKLSDAELHRRGLSRDTLAQHAFSSYDR